MAGHVFSFECQPNFLVDNTSAGFLINTQFMSGLVLEELGGMNYVNIDSPLDSDVVDEAVIHVNQSTHTTDCSSIVVNTSCDKAVTHHTDLSDKKRKKNSALSSFNYDQTKKNNGGRKGKKQKKFHEKGGEENQEEKEELEEKRAPKWVNNEETSTGYIHVRARRGQATDSHSLAERVRREKISERMKILQRLVPGCDKVTGKALVLDEIINYLQSLQYQVEFLSMKLASVDPFYYDSTGTDASALMIPAERVNNNSLVLPSVSPFSPSQPVSFADSNTTLIATNHLINDAYPMLLHSSSTSIFRQDQTPCDDPTQVVI